MARIRRQRSGDVLVQIEEHEAALVQRLVSDIQTLLDDRPSNQTAPAHAEFLSDFDALFGPTQPPCDPALARLLPDGYRDDPESAGELRRLTEGSLRQAKSETAQRVLDSLPDGGGRIVLPYETAHAWLTAFNDVRLVLGTRLNVTEDTFDEVSLGVYESDPESAAYVIYHWLSMFQEQLVEAVEG